MIKKLIRPLHTTSTVALALGISTLGLSGPVAASEATNDSAQSAVEYESYHGPRKTIAVGQFDAVGSFLGEYGGWDVGGGLSAMLASELNRSNRFVVIERATLDPILQEKQLALTNVTSGVDKGQLLGAQIIVQASVTEFDRQSKGGGLNVGLNVGGFLGGLGGRSERGSLALDIRLIDANSGTIISTHTVRKRIKSSSLALRGNVRGVSLGADGFSNSPLGKVMRTVIGEAVQTIVADLHSVSWEGLIADVNGRRITINAGKNADLRVGNKLRAVRTERVITDPLTGEVLGSDLRTIGDLVIERVENRFATGTWVSTEAPRRGDTVRFVS